MGWAEQGRDPALFSWAQPGSSAMAPFMRHGWLASQFFRQYQVIPA
jgi:hypothetical protein